MENQSSAARDKIRESVEKYSEMLGQKKYYEFAQKIRSLSQRKKPEDCEQMLVLAIEKMLGWEETEINAANDLIVQLLQLYSKQRQLWNEATASKLFRLLNIKPNPRRVEHYLTIINKLCRIEHCPQIAEDLIGYFEGKQQFALAEPHVVSQSMSRISEFLQKWKGKVNEEEYVSIVARMALLKGLYADANFDQSMVLLAEVPGHDPFVKFARFLIQAVQMKSRECFQKIGTCYSKFLAKDVFYSQIHDAYGVKFFKKERKEVGGLQGLMTSFK